MVTIECFCDDDTAVGSAQPGEDQERALNKAMKRAEKVRRELVEAIHRVTTSEDANVSSSSDSDNEGADDGRCLKEGRRRHHHGPHDHGPQHVHHGPHGAQHPRHPMTGRHMMGFGKFPGMMRHGVGRRPHHPPHLHLHPHPHHHHRHHHHMGHSFGAHGYHCGRGHHGHGHRHGHGSAMKAFSAVGMGHASGHRVRA